MPTESKHRSYFSAGAKRIETVLAAEPNLMDRIHRDARQRALQSLGLADWQVELDDQSRATELTLTNSRLEGDPITINSNREYLLRALRLGFREVHLFANDVPVLFDDGRRQFVFALLEPKAVIPSIPDPIRIESPRHQKTGANGAHKQRRSKPVMSEPTTPVTTATIVSRDKSPAKRKRSATQTQGVIEQTIALRDALRSAVIQANELIRALKQQKRESRIVRSTLDSLRQLQKVGV